MRRVRAAALCAVLAAAAGAAIGQAPGQSRPNWLVPRQAAAGWLLLFDGETSFGWAPRGDARWSVGGGSLHADAGGPGVLATTTAFASFELRVDCRIAPGTNSGILLRGPDSGPITAANAVEVNLSPDDTRWPTGSLRGLAQATAGGAQQGPWTRVVVRAAGRRFQVSLNGKPVAAAQAPRALARGVIALQYGGLGRAEFRNVMLRPLGLKPLTDGKSLAGWNALPGHPSVYSVTPQGWINVRGGNGDLQSQQTFGDFVLQLGILSNGEHLNSGIFFRATAGRFWSGYECQIRNQWEGDDRSKPVDFGTGGIYGRQAARRVVSSDHAWFTMTVVAEGRHIATWVDGVQVTDWVDPREPDEENAREGSRTRAGVISLQGHDPTTDLSFRGIRAVELPPPTRPAAPARRAPRRGPAGGPTGR